MLAVVTSATISGIDAIPVSVEADISGGIPGFATVGLPESTVRESRVRVQSAINNSGLQFPVGRITVNLAPAHVRKDGTGFDLPIAVALLAADGLLPEEKLRDFCFMGELSLSGELRPVRGVLAAAIAAKARGLKRLMVAPENGAEAAVVSGITVHVARTFKEVFEFLTLGTEPSATATSLGEGFDNSLKDIPDMADVRGQHTARRALEIAAAGGHNVLFVGGPGAGKTMMARRLPGILPSLSEEESLEVTRVYSVAGLTLGSGLIRERPFRAPHHSMTRAGLVGGGAGMPRPGEISLANHGVLFLDELPEFSRDVLEVLRQPLESGEVILSRANAAVRYPAKIMFVAAMNPCPCGHLGSRKRQCRCSPMEIARYRSKLSGPLFDRVDLHVQVPPLEIALLQDDAGGESSRVIRERVLLARKAQQQRMGGTFTNATMTKRMLTDTVKLSDASKKMLAMAAERLHLSARAYDRAIRVSRTLADLEGSADVDVHHVSEAVQYRSEEESMLAA
jgi:magnesium chelatase family protein